MTTYSIIAESFSRASGHGMDRYAHELVDQLSGSDLQGVQKFEIGRGNSVTSHIMKQTIATFRAPLVKARLFHATSQIAAAPFIIANKHPLIVTIHDMIPFSNAITRFTSSDSGTKHLYQRTLIKLCSHADEIIVPFSATADDVHNLLGIKRARITIIPYAAPIKSDYCLPTDGISIKNANEKRRILFLGGVNKNKGIDNLIEAVNLLKDDNIELWVAGTGPHLEEMQVKVSSLGLNNVKFLGFVPDDKIKQVYQSCDLFVYPSKIGFGLTIFESILAGIPCIMSGTSDNKQIFGNNGLYCNQEDPQDIKKQIESVIHDTEIRRKYLLAEYSTISKQHSWSNISKQIVTVYGKCI